eukprot:PhF_6_TR12940/c0_g1_i1/m.20421
MNVVLLILTVFFPLVCGVTLVTPATYTGREDEEIALTGFTIMSTGTITMTLSSSVTMYCRISGSLSWVSAPCVLGPMSAAALLTTVTSSTIRTQTNYYGTFALQVVATDEFSTVTKSIDVTETPVNDRPYIRYDRAATESTLWLNCPVGNPLYLGRFTVADPDVTATDKVDVILYTPWGYWSLGNYTPQTWTDVTWLDGTDVTVPSSFPWYQYNNYLHFQATVDTSNQLLSTLAYHPPLGGWIGTLDVLVLLSDIGNTGEMPPDTTELSDTFNFTISVTPFRYFNPYTSFLGQPLLPTFNSPGYVTRQYLRAATTTSCTTRYAGCSTDLDLYSFGSVPTAWVPTQTGTIFLCISLNIYAATPSYTVISTVGVSFVTAPTYSLSTSGTIPYRSSLGVTIVGVSLPCKSCVIALRDATCQADVLTAPQKISATNSAQFVSKGLGGQVYVCFSGTGGIVYSRINAFSGAPNAVQFFPRTRSQSLSKTQDMPSFSVTQSETFENSISSSASGEPSDDPSTTKSIKTPTYSDSKSLTSHPLPTHTRGLSESDSLVSTRTVTLELTLGPTLSGTNTQDHSMSHSSTLDSSFTMTLSKTISFSDSFSQSQERTLDDTPSESGSIEGTRNTQSPTIEPSGSFTKSGGSRTSSFSRTDTVEETLVETKSSTLSRETTKSVSSSAFLEPSFTATPSKSMTKMATRSVTRPPRTFTRQRTQDKSASFSLSTTGQVTEDFSKTITLTNSIHSVSQELSPEQSSSVSTSVSKTFTRTISPTFSSTKTETGQHTMTLSITLRRTATQTLSFAHSTTISNTLADLTSTISHTATWSKSTEHTISSSDSNRKTETMSESLAHSQSNSISYAEFTNSGSRTSTLTSSAEHTMTWSISQGRPSFTLSNTLEISFTISVTDERTATLKWTPTPSITDSITIENTRRTASNTPEQMSYSNSWSLSLSDSLSVPPTPTRSKELSEDASKSWSISDEIMSFSQTKTVSMDRSFSFHTHSSEGSTSNSVSKERTFTRSTKSITHQPTDTSNWLNKTRSGSPSDDFRTLSKTRTITVDQTSTRTESNTREITTTRTSTDSLSKTVSLPSMTYYVPPTPSPTPPTPSPTPTPSRTPRPPTPSPTPTNEPPTTESPPPPETFSPSPLPTPGVPEPSVTGVPSVVPTLTPSNTPSSTTQYLPSVSPTPTPTPNSTNQQQLSTVTLSVDSSGKATFGKEGSSARVSVSAFVVRSDIEVVVLAIPNISVSGMQNRNYGTELRPLWVRCLNVTFSGERGSLTLQYTIVDSEGSLKWLGEAFSVSPGTVKTDIYLNYNGSLSASSYIFVALELQASLLTNTTLGIKNFDNSNVGRVIIEQETPNARDDLGWLNFSFPVGQSVVHYDPLFSFESRQTLKDIMELNHGKTFAILVPGILMVLSVMIVAVGFLGSKRKNRIQSAFETHV